MGNRRESNRARSRFRFHLVFAFAFAGAVLCAPRAAFSAEQWLKLTSPNFELYTTAGERDGRAAILHFEQIHSFFRTGTGQESSFTGRVRIVAFRSEKEFRPYRPNEVAAAFYTSVNDHDYIVMRDITQDSYWAAVHEYFHLWVKDTKLPLWLNEGLADFYSTLQPSGDKVKIGDFPPGKFQILQQSKWINLETLIAVDHASPFYNEKDRAGTFYAESWALVHMLNFSPSYHGEFERFYFATATGMESKAAFQQFYGKTVDEVQKDLEEYMRGFRFMGALLNLKLEKSTDNPSVQPAGLESGIALADLLASRKEAFGEARKAYEQVGRENPNSWQVEEGLGYLALKEKDKESRDQAKTHFARAAELGSTDAKFYLAYAILLSAENGNRADSERLVRQAIQLQPDLREAHYTLGILLLQQRKYVESIHEFGEVRHVSQQQAFPMFRALAYAYSQVNQQDDARNSAEKAKQYARTPEELAQAEDLLKSLAREAPMGNDTPSRPTITRSERNSGGFSVPAQTAEEDKTPSWPTSVIEGSLEQFECFGNIAIVRILSDGKPMALAIRNPNAVSIRGAKSGAVDFTCGLQSSSHLVLEYDPHEDKDLGTVGDVRSIQFK